LTKIRTSIATAGIIAASVCLETVPTRHKWRSRRSGRRHTRRITRSRRRIRPRISNQRICRRTTADIAARSCALVAVAYAVIASHPGLTSSCRRGGCILGRSAAATCTVVLDRLTLWVVGIVFSMQNPREGFYVAGGGIRPAHRKHQFLSL
jgi:hypothetical protein